MLVDCSGNLRSFNSLKMLMPISSSPMRRPNQIHPAAGVLLSHGLLHLCVCESSFSSLQCEHPQIRQQDVLACQRRDQCASLRKCTENRMPESQCSTARLNLRLHLPMPCNVASRAITRARARYATGARGPLLYSSPQSQSGNVVAPLHGLIASLFESRILPSWPRPKLPANTHLL